MSTRWTAALVVATLMGSGAWAQQSGSPTIDAVRKRGELVCGVAGTVAGFSLPDAQGVMRGLDADSCRAVAAAVLGDAGKVRWVPLTSANRFTALQSGEVDVLFRQATITLGREANLGFEFAGVNFYDGTAFLTKTAAGLKSARQLDGATVCMPLGTSTELAVADYFRTQGIRLVPVKMEDQAELQRAFSSGRCDAYATDSSALAAFRSQQGERKGDYTLLPDVISKEPLAGVVRKGDDKWLDVVRWSHSAMLQAEELQITAANAEAQLQSTSPDVRRLLGVEGDLGKALGVDNRWAFNIVRQVGNFAEVWDRNIEPLGVPRGLNRLWNQGGLQYPPPFR